MNIEQIRYFAQYAANQWDQAGKSARDCAEDSWFVLFSLRVNLELLPADLRFAFLRVWECYGGGDPRLITRTQQTRMLDGLSGTGLHDCETMTRDFASALEVYGVGSLRLG